MAGRQGSGARISFKVWLCGQTAVDWQSVLYKDTLYLKPGDTLPDGSKEAFVALLEYAEESLCCRQIVVCFKKDAVDRGILVRTFMFLGFRVIPPGHPAAPKGDYICLLYSIVEEDDDLDSDSDGDVSGRRRLDQFNNRLRLLNQDEEEDEGFGLI